MNNVKLSLLCILGMQSMMMPAALESKFPVKEIPSLQNIIASNILIDFNNKINENPSFSQHDLDCWMDYVTKHQIFFKDVINGDIHSQNNKVIIKKGDLLWEAVGKNNVHMVQLLIAAGAHVNIQDDGWTPLSWAAFNNHIEITGMLIAAGADLNIQDQDHLNPLHLAIHKNNTEIIGMLIAAGAHVNIQDKRGYASLHWAVILHNVKVARIFINAGANINIKNNLGKTPLYQAVMTDNAGMVQFFLQAGADVHAQDNNGWTPLHRAVFDNKTEITCMLLEAGVNVNIKDTYGRIAEELAKTPELRALFAQAR